jgi:cell division protein FtsQ
LRSGNLFSKRDAAVLDAPAQNRAPARTGGYGYDKGGEPDAEVEFAGRVRQPGVRLSFNGGILPKTRWGRIAAGCGVVAVAGVGVAGLLMFRSFLLRDEHFVVEGAGSIQIAGNSHLTRPQLLSVFGGDVERNIFGIPLAERRAELERLPWVAHATVMRLLPNRVQVAIVERTPVAFVRQGKEIGLVDANGVLLDMASPVDLEDSQGLAPNEAAHYSFPVVTGISASDPGSTRAARMKIYMGFVAALDAAGEKISQKLSEVDVSNPEDVKAVLPGGTAGGSADSDVLVHFGDGRFLERYRKYEQHLAEWRTQYPRLASVDMRYERQVVLEMQPGTEASPGNAAGAGSWHPTHDDHAVNGTPVHAVAKNVDIPKPAAAKPSVVKTGAGTASGLPAAPHLTTAFAVGPKAGDGKPAAAVQGAPR